MRSKAYLVYLLLHLLFHRITATLNTVWLRTRRGDRDRTIEKGTFYPNSYRERLCPRGPSGSGNPEIIIDNLVYS